MNTRTVALIVIVVGIVLLFAFSQKKPPVVEEPITTVSYACSGGKSITAAYYEGETKPAPAPDQPPIPGGRVALTLSDGRAMTLPQTISADGVRYANSDETFVFWNKGNGALVLENNQEKSYMGCIAVAPAPTDGTLSQVYTNSAEGFSIRLGKGYAVDESYRYQELGPGKDISGIKFTIPETLATSTNLAADSYMSVEKIPKTGLCSAALFTVGTTTQTVADAGTTYSVASSTGAAAGNRYEETVYAIPGTSPCIALRYVIHYGVFQNYPAGTVREFDKVALLKEFDTIRRTLIVVQ